MWVDTGNLGQIEERNVNSFEKLLAVVEQQPLSQSLPRALLIATRIDDEELGRWIRLEVMGYFADNPALTVETVVPEYRSVSGQWYDDFGRALAINDPGLAFINEIRLRPGVAELEGVAAGTESLAMRPTEFSEIIRRDLKVEVSLFRFRPSSVKQVLTNIKVQSMDQIERRREKIAAIPEIPEVPATEVFHLKPGAYGMSVDLKALWRRLVGTIR